MNWRYLSRFRSELMGISCIYVMLFHNFFQWKEIGAGGNLFHSFFARGNVGVDCFLFLSGIGLYYSFSKVENVISFYKKRFLRLLLPYLVIAVPGYAALNPPDGLWASILQISFIKRGANLTWFIPCILLMYILFPLIYYLQYKEIAINGHIVHRNVVTVLMCLIYFIGLLFIQKCFGKLYNNTEIALTRGIVFILGCHCAKYVKEERPLPTGTVLACAAFIPTYIYLFIGQNKLTTMWTRLTYVPFSVAILVVVSYLLAKISGNSPKRRFNVLRFFGERSLELYLTHVILSSVYQVYIGVPHFEKTAVIDYGIVLVLAVLISGILHPLFVRANNFFDKSKGVPIDNRPI